MLLGLKIIGPLNIEAGPVYNRILTSTDHYHGNNVDINPNGLGYRAGINVQLGIVGFNVSYQSVWNNVSVFTTLSSLQTYDEIIFGASFVLEIIRLCSKPNAEVLPKLLF